MGELGYDGGDVRQVGRSRPKVRLRRPLLLIAVTLLCGASFFAGIWFGTQARITCTVSSPNLIVCEPDGGTPPPARSHESGSA